MIRLFSLQLPFWWLLLSCVLRTSVADIEATSGGGVESVCKGNDDCKGDLTCTLGYCVPQKCITRELKAVGARFDPLQYKDMIFQEAKIKDVDIFRARVDNPNNIDFVQAAPVVALKKTLQAHRQELMGLASIMRYCSSSDGSETPLSEEEEDDSNGSQAPDGHRERRRAQGDERQMREESESSEDAESTSSDEESLFARSVEAGGGLGAWVGDLFATVTNLFNRGRGTGETTAGHESKTVEKIPVDDSSDDTPAPSGAPTISNAPSVSSRPSFVPSVSLEPSRSPSDAPSLQPSESPSYAVSTKIYIGFHIEGGLLMDYSCSYLFPTESTTNDNNLSDEYVRTCVGAEFGVGAEIAFVAVFANVRENADIVGVNLMSEFADTGLGVHIGAGVGVFTEGPATLNGNQLLLYDATIGAGLGFSIFGTAVCRINELTDGI